jgi:hypothetical protein
VQVRLRVHPDDAPFLAAVLHGPQTTVNLELTCSHREYTEALQALARDGHAIEVEVRGEPPPGRESRPLLESTQDRILWPFPARLIPDAALARIHSGFPPGTVLRVTRQSVRVAPPPTIPSAAELQRAGFAAVVVVEPPSVELEGPKSLLDEPLVPDAIDLLPLLEDAALREAPSRHVLTFREWGSQARDGPGRAAWRQQVAGRITGVVATARLEPVGRREIINDLVILLDPAYEVDIGDKAAVEVQGSTQLRLMGTLEGRSADLEALAADAEARRATWFWGLRLLDREGLPDPVGGQEAEVSKRAEIVYLPAPERRETGVTFAPTQAQESFPVTVRLRPR